MRRPSVIRLDRSVAKTAFAIQSAHACTLEPSCIALEVRRAGTHGAPLRYCASERDDDERFVFEWDRRIRCLAPGLYSMRLVAAGVPCGELLAQLGDECAVTGFENFERSECGPLDATQPGCHDCHGAACDCDPVPVIYVPAYDVPRGC
ncbi:hypothetical protein WI84_16270 [Burkholderia ubonensis]|uniref:hypothetical protein n=1 Tax=Burkholderia ubonensis TaxID=101571 RepID=UPI00075DC418|nr:hypothetical protein [Burkholderia ubonensis]KVD35424.1 hypothetical protein WI84_16270 [Burkholderia ubonensis]